MPCLSWLPALEIIRINCFSTTTRLVDFLLPLQSTMMMHGLRVIVRAGQHEANEYLYIQGSWSRGGAGEDERDA